MNIRSGSVYCGNNYVGVNDTGWNLIGDVGVRIFLKVVTFSTPFTGSTPTVIPMLASIHQLSEGEVKLDITATNVTVSGFTLQLVTWDDCQIKGVGANYIAYAP